MHHADPLHCLYHLLAWRPHMLFLFPCYPCYPSGGELPDHPVRGQRAADGGGAADEDHPVTAVPPPDALGVGQQQGGQGPGVVQQAAASWATAG
jgi:hypothetical protein